MCVNQLNFLLFGVRGCTIIALVEVLLLLHIIIIIIVYLVRPKDFLLVSHRASIESGRFFRAQSVSHERTGACERACWRCTATSGAARIGSAALHAGAEEDQGPRCRCQWSD